MLTPEARADKIITDIDQWTHYYELDYGMDTLSIEDDKLARLIAAAIRAATEEAVALERARIKAELALFLHMAGSEAWVLDSLIDYIQDM